MAQSFVVPVELRGRIPEMTSAETTFHSMDSSERWKQFANDYLTGQGAIVRSLKTAIFAQVNDNPSAWSSTSRGFVERFGSSFARNATQGAITDSMAAALGHDTRYLPCNCSGFRRRLVYSLQMTVLTRNTKGNKVFDVSRLAGIYGGALVATSWQPHRLSLPAESARLTGIGMSTALLTSVAREFKPELKAMLRHYRSLAPVGTP
jgi:hypothetical protein